MKNKKRVRKNNKNIENKKTKIYLIVLAMFLVSLLIGLFVLKVDPLHVQTFNESSGKFVEISNPDFDFIESPDLNEGTNVFGMLMNFVFAFMMAIVLILILSKIKADFFLRLWFFLVVVFALYICFYAFQSYFFNLQNNLRILLPLGLAFILSVFKIYKRNILIHNITELFIYPGIAVIFISLLNIYSLVVILILISVYDMWAVWHTSLMQKMASYQIQSVGVFGGFLIPYASKQVKDKIKKLKQKYKSKKEIPESEIKKQKISVELAVLGGGDIVFSIISLGVVYKFLGLIPSLFVGFGAFLSLVYLFFESKKKKHESYPAMPFITIGVFLAIILSMIGKFFGFW
ncbi:MAG: hypothetical protein ACOCUU_03650 [Nanoarchaeota archaeon]